MQAVVARGSRAVGVVVALLFAALLPFMASAHKASDAYLQLHAAPAGGAAGIELRWDIALRDLDAAVDLDADGDARLTWREIRAAWPAIDAYALPRLAIAGCPLQVARRGLERRSDGAYAVLWLESPCALPAEPAVSYSLFAGIDPTHRGILKLERAGEPAQVLLLQPVAPGGAAGGAAGAASGAASATAAAAAPAAAVAGGTAAFLREGVHHILTGYDHVLFLLALLLPAALRRTPQGWRPVGTLGQAVWPVVGIVTAFTIAHSITLALAALDLVTLPPWFIEPAIAATIVIAAVDNLVPVLRLPRGVVTFAFGLVHGFGFAGVLAELDLPTGAFVRALLGFNIGLELGQLAIVVVAVSLLYAARRWHGYPRWIIGLGSVTAIVIGGIWFVERTAHVSLLRF